MVIYDFKNFNNKSIKYSSDSIAKNNHILTRNGYLYSIFNDIEIKKNTDYYIDLDLIQQFKYNKNKLEFYIYGYNRNILKEYLLKVPKHKGIFHINSKENNAFNILLFSKKQINNSVITISKFQIYYFLKKYTNIADKKIDVLTDQLFNILEEEFNNKSNDSNFDYIYKELDLLCDKDKKVRSKALILNDSDSTISNVSTISNNSMSGNSADNENSSEDGHVSSISSKDLLDNNKNNNESNNEILLETGSESEKDKSPKNNFKNINIINNFSSDDGYVSSNSGNSLSSGDKKIKFSLHKKIKENIKSTDCSTNILATYNKKLIYNLELNDNNFERYGTYILYNNNEQNPKSIDIYNKTDDYGYVYIDMSLKCGNYMIDYEYDKNYNTNFDMLITDSHHLDVSYNHQIETHISQTKYRKLYLFNLPNNNSCIKFIIYFTNKCSNLNSIRLYSLKIYKINSTDPSFNIVDTNLNLTSNSIDISGQQLYCDTKPNLCIEQQYKKIKQEVLYEFNFAKIQDNICDFNICGIDLGYTYNNKGLFVRSNSCNSPGYIMFKKPLLCNTNNIIINLDVKSINGVTGTIFIHNGGNVIDNILIEQTTTNIKRLVDITGSNGICYFILKIDQATTSSIYNGLILGNLRISEITIDFVDKFDHKATESQLDYTENTAPTVPTIGPIESGGDTIQSLANIQEAILKLI